MSRILYIPTHEYPPTRGGIAFYIEESARAAAQSGWQVHVLAPDKATPDRVADGTHNGQLHVHRLPLMGNQNWPDRLRTWQAMSRAQEDWSKVTLWLAEPGPLRLWTYDWFLPLPKPERLIVTLHGSEFVRAQRWPHRRFLLNRLLLKANRVGVVSEFVADIVCGALPRLRNKLVLVPGALRSAFPVAEVFPESDSRHIGSDQLRILTVGRMHPRKRPTACCTVTGFAARGYAQAHHLDGSGAYCSP
ncbi:MAG: glycosyltransferase [Verrucomicrobia bacterium]|nr:glycosyltransferase [Verrucomicrobiota bacterium]